MLQNTLINPYHFISTHITHYIHIKLYNTFYIYASKYLNQPISFSHSGGYCTCQGKRPRSSSLSNKFYPET